MGKKIEFMEERIGGKEGREKAGKQMGKQVVKGPKNVCYE